MCCTAAYHCHDPHILFFVSFLCRKSDVKNERHAAQDENAHLLPPSRRARFLSVIVMAVIATAAALIVRFAAANYRGGCPLARLITMSAPDIQPRAARFQICSAGAYGFRANRSAEREEGKKGGKGRKGEKRRGEYRGPRGEGRAGRVQEGDRRGDSYHLARFDVG